MKYEKTRPVYIKEYVKFYCRGYAKITSKTCHTWNTLSRVWQHKKLGQGETLTNHNIIPCYCRETKLLLANPYANIEGQRIVVIPQQCKQRRTLKTFNQMTRNKYKLRLNLVSLSTPQLTRDIARRGCSSLQPL